LWGEELEQVDQFKHLGVAINKNGKIEELNCRITNTRILYEVIHRGLLGKEERSQETKIDLSIDKWAIDQHTSLHSPMDVSHGY